MSARGIAVVLLGLLVFSGVAGISAGGQSAQAGWWLVIVCGTLLVVVLLARTRAA